MLVEHEHRIEMRKFSFLATKLQVAVINVLCDDINFRVYIKYFPFCQLFTRKSYNERNPFTRKWGQKSHNGTVLILIGLRIRPLPSSYSVLGSNLLQKYSSLCWNYSYFKEVISKVTNYQNNFGIYKRACYLYFYNAQFNSPLSKYKQNSIAKNERSNVAAIPTHQAERNISKKKENKINTNRTRLFILRGKSEQ